MGSGKYGAVSGAIGRMQMMNNISEHLAAVKTTAYKRGKMNFEAELGEANSGLASKGVNYTRVSREVIDFTPGNLEFTGNPLHLAINGDGFFQVQRDDGSIGYVRKGSFQLNADGQLIDNSNRPLLTVDGAPINLPHANVDIAPDGSIYADGAELAQIGLFQFADNSVLQRVGEGLFQPSDGSQPLLHPNPQMIQKNIETSNVDMMREMVRMTSNLRAFEATQKALSIYRDMDSKGAEIGLVQ
jgi:flagellar basal body rod protein FlgG